MIFCTTEPQMFYLVECVLSIATPYLHITRDHEIAFKRDFNTILKAASWWKCFISGWTIPVSSLVYMLNFLIRHKPQWSLLSNLFIFLLFRRINWFVFDRLLFDAHRCLSIFLSLSCNCRSSERPLEQHKCSNGGRFQIKSPPTWSSSLSVSSWHEWGHLSNQRSAQSQSV